MNGIKVNKAPILKCPFDQVQALEQCDKTTVYNVYKIASERGEITHDLSY